MPRRSPSARLALLLTTCTLACAGGAARAPDGPVRVSRDEGPPPAVTPRYDTPGVVIVSAFGRSGRPVVQAHVRAAFATNRRPLAAFTEADTLLTTVPVLVNGREVVYRAHLDGGGQNWLVFLDGYYTAPGDTVRVALRGGRRGWAGNEWQRLLGIAESLYEHNR